MARPPASANFYYEQTAGGAVVRREGECPFDGWSLEALPGDESFFATLAARDRINLAQLELFYQSFDRRGEAYLRGVQLNAILESELEVDEVLLVSGKFVREGDGAYRLLIEEIRK